ncbi:MAG: protein translocase subunit SecF [Armatimonadetes bacterium]|nr:protein translocase subunit SecF [Armatimonadota bacterium]
MSSETKSAPFRILPNALWWFVATWILIASGLFRMGQNRAATGEMLSFGIDFAGGAAYVYKFDQRPGQSSVEVIGRVREVLSTLGVQRAKIEEFAGNQVQIRTLTGTGAERAGVSASEAAKAEAEKILQALVAKFGKVDLVGSELVGPVIGASLRKQAVLALLLGNLLVLGYISIRYNIGGLGGGVIFGSAAVLALIHDVGILFAVYAWTRTEVNSGFVAALLTVVGYSVNDTVVIFDRIRENLRALDAPLRRNVQVVEATMEASIWQTMSRSVLTVTTTLLPLITLCFFGGVTLRDFAFALLVGIISGAYSSILQATPIVMWWNRRAIRKAAEAAGRLAPQRPMRRTERPVPAATAPTPASRPAPARPAPAPAADTGPDAADTPAADTSAAAKPEARTTGKSARPKSGQRKRRH